MPKLKAKGVFAAPAPGKFDLRHSLMHNVCAIAVQEYLSAGTPIEETIRINYDIHNFLITHAATKNFVCSWRGEVLGKLVRFYKSTDDQGPIIKSNAEKSQIVPSSESSVPLMDIPDEFPIDIDYEWYIDKAQEWVDEISRPKATGMNRLCYRLALIGLTPAVVDSDPGAKASRARFKVGDIDFNALPPGKEIGVSTGADVGTVAIIDPEDGVTLALYRYDGPLPSKTRPTVERDQGRRIVYGANVRISKEVSYAPEGMVKQLPQSVLDLWLEKYYTPSELKKVGINR